MGDDRRWWKSERGIDVEVTRRGLFPGPGGSPPVLVPFEQGPGIPPRVPSAQDSPQVRLRFPPWLEKIGPVSRDFNVNDFDLALLAAVGATASSVALSFTLPTGQVGWLQEATLYARNTTNTTRIRYMIRINEAPVAGMDNFQILPGVTNLEAIDKNGLAIRIPDGAKVDILITNLAAQVEAVGGRLAGWYHPKSAEIEAWGEV